MSWAILGEAYGKDDELKNLKIKYRRIRSILDDKTGFDKTINYIPERIFFNADPALLKLLIGPLYGEDPKYGIRELLQNSVDAVKEREYLKNSNGKITITLKPIKVDKPRYEIIISDTGIGMDKDTIINYFFKAGASFRKSMAWKKNFVDDNDSKIQKTGRFGVGVLAAFLLGDEFELWSKYDSIENQGYYCKASLTTTQVELIKQDCQIGTTIKITLKDSVNAIINQKFQELDESTTRKKAFYNSKSKLLEWFTWYLMDKPQIEYIIDDKLKKIFSFLKRDDLVSSNSEIPSKFWKSFKTKDYKSIHWVLNLNDVNYYYGLRNSQSYNKLICNGFKINKSYILQDKTYQWLLPNISIFDNNANFPLSLNRDYIQEDYLPFEKELLENISLELISAILKTNFKQIGPYYIPQPNILKFIGEIDLSNFIVVIGDEFTILDSSIFSTLKLRSFDQFWFRSQGAKLENYNFIPKSAYQASVISSDPITFYRPILEATHYSRNGLKNWFNLNSRTNLSNSDRKDIFSRQFISSSKLKYLSEGARLTKSFKNKITSNNINNEWDEIVSDKEKKQESNIDIKNLNSNTYPLIIEHFTQLKTENNFFIETWEKVLGKEWTFPVDVQKRPDISKHLKI